MVSVRSLPLFLLRTNVSKELIQASKLPSYCINLELCKFILCQMCATAPFHLKKIFRRSNKYLLRRYKRNMFRVVFR